MPVKVQKKDGRMEDFDRNKIFGGIVKSGTTSEEAENATRQIESWVQAAAVNGIINSGQIRSKLLEILRGVNPTAATAFEAYQKPVSPPPGEQPPVPPVA